MCLREIDLSDVVWSNVGSFLFLRRRRRLHLLRARRLLPAARCIDHQRERMTQTLVGPNTNTKYIFHEAHVVGCVRAYVCFRARCNCRLADHVFSSAGAGMSAREDIL